MRQQMVGNSQLVVQTTSNLQTDRRANPPKKNNTKGLGVRTRPWYLGIVDP